MTSRASPKAPPTAAKRPRGRPRKQNQVEQVLATAAAAQSLTQLVELPSCTQPPSMEQPQQQPPDNNGDAIFCKAFLGFIEQHLGGQAWLKKLIAQETAREVRGDPRTEEMKLMKTELDKIKAQVDRLSSATKDDKELDKRILEEAVDLKRKHKEVSELVEPLSKRAANMEAQQKALQARMNAMEDRVRAVEVMK